MADLAQYGWDEGLAEAFRAWKGDGTAVGRVAVDYAKDYLVYTADGEVRAETAGRLRRRIERGEATKPAVGDWVVIDALGGGRGVVHGVLPRRSKLSRKIAGRTTEEQVVAANVDVIFLVAGATGDVNFRRLERNLTLAWESGATPVVVITKRDLCPDPALVDEAVRSIAGRAAVHFVSNKSGEGVEALSQHLAPGRTVVLVGSSGVGKSTLVNRWLGSQKQLVADVRDWDQKGRHTTTHRELFVLESGALVIDTPGVRELALWEGEQGITEAFPDVLELAEGCRFRDCRHEEEPGCAVREAASSGALDSARFDAYRKLAAELVEIEKRQTERNRGEGKRPAPAPFRRR